MRGGTGNEYFPYIILTVNLGSSPNLQTHQKACQALMELLCKALKGRFFFWGGGFYPGKKPMGLKNLEVKLAVQFRVDFEFVSFLKPIQMVYPLLNGLLYIFRLLALPNHLIFAFPTAAQRLGYMWIF